MGTEEKKQQFEATIQAPISFTIQTAQLPLEELVKKDAF